MHTAVVIASAVVLGHINTSEMSTAPAVPLTPLAGALPPTSMKVPALSSVFTEVVILPAPATSASTPAMAPPEVVVITQAPTELFPSVVDSPTLM